MMRARDGKPAARLAGTALALAAAILAGCGADGASEPTAADRRAALDRWQSAADGACRKGNASIAERGWPVSLVDLDRLTVRAIVDIREASTAIQRLPAPKGSEGRVAPFVQSLKGLEPLMERLSSTTEDFKPGKLEAFVPKLSSGLTAVEEEAKKLGLRHCAANDEHAWVPDAIRAPVFAEQVAFLDRRLARRVKAIDDSAATNAEAARKLEKLSDLVEGFDRGLSRLKPPAWAEAEAGLYVDALRDLGAALEAGSTELTEGTLTPAEARAAQAKLARAGRHERKRAKRLNRAIGAIPVLPGGGGGESESPGGDETQEA